MAKHNELGKWGEQVACDHLVTLGYAIMERNWRMGHYEIDIVAAKDDRIVFAEVKTRAGHDIDPLTAVDSRKRSHMARAAHVYIQSHDIILEPQFDLFGICGNPENFKMEHIADAFLPPLHTY